MLQCLKHYRQANGLSQREFGQMVGLSQVFICMLESGERKINPLDVAKFSKITGIPKAKLRPDVFGDELD